MHGYWEGVEFTLQPTTCTESSVIKSSLRIVHLFVFFIKSTQQSNSYLYDASNLMNNLNECMSHLNSR